MPSAYEIEVVAIRGREPLFRAVYRAPTVVSLGTNPRASVSLPDGSLPDHLDLLRLDEGQSYLRFESDTIVEADLGSGPKKGRELIAAKVAREGREGWTLDLQVGHRGLVQFGELRFLWRVLSRRPGEERITRGGERPACVQCAAAIPGLSLAPTALHPCGRCGTLNRLDGGAAVRELGATVGAIPTVPENATPHPPTRKIGPLPGAEALPSPPGPRTPAELEGMRTVSEIKSLSPSPPQPYSMTQAATAQIDIDEMPTPPGLPAVGALGMAATRPSGPPVASAPPPGPTALSVGSPTASPRGAVEAQRSVAPAPPATPEKKVDLPAFEPLARLKPSEAPAGPGRKKAHDLPTFDGISVAREAAVLEGTGSPDAVPTPVVPPRSLRPNNNEGADTLPPPPGPRVERSGADLPSQDAIGSLKGQGLSTRAAIVALRGGAEAQEPPVNSEGAAAWEPIGPTRLTTPQEESDLDGVGPTRDEDTEHAPAVPVPDAAPAVPHPPPTARLDSLEELPEVPAQRVRRQRPPEPPPALGPYIAVGLICGVIGLALLYYAFRF